MKCLITFIMLFPLLHSSIVNAQDTIPTPGSFDEGYLFVGPDDVLKFKGYAQFDSYFPLSKSPGISEFLVREARFAATGYFQKKFRYMLNASWDKGKAALNEAFLESRHLSFAKLRVGQFKVPFSLSNLTSSSQLDMIDRSFVVQAFSPSYDIGAMLFGEDKLNYIDYALGIFNGTGSNRPESNNQKMIIGRLVIAPLKSSEHSVFSKLYLGGSFSIGIQNTDLSNMAYKTPQQAIVFAFNDSIRQNGKATIYGFDMEWIVNNFSLKGEYLNYKLNDVKSNTSIFDFKSSGYYLSATYLITGENKTRNKILKPKKEFNPKKGYWGAFELVARYEKTELPSSVLAANLAKGINGLRAITGGINWYLNDDVKLVLNYSKYFFKQNLLVENELYSSSNNILVRVQYQF